MPSVCSCLSHIYIVFYSKEVISSHVIWKGLVWRENKPHCHVVLHLFCGMLKRGKKIILSYTVRNILNYHHKLDNDVKKNSDFSIKIIRAAILIVVKRKCRTCHQGGRISWYVFVMLQVSEVIVQVAWVWEHRSTSMAPPPCMDDDKNR